MTWALDPLEPGSAQCIVADPPWRFQTWNKATAVKRRGGGTNVSASVHYNTMTIEDITALPVADLAAKDCALFLWVVNPMLPDGLDVMAAWGFRFKTVAFCWAKTTPKTQASWAPKYHIGLGYWSRANVELCLLGTRGKPVRLAKNVRQLVVSPRREHSRKPDEVYEAIERLVPGPRAELFARVSRPGWSSWGFESTKFDDLLTGQVHENKKLEQISALQRPQAAVDQAL
jgi:N6-adenosine-specific RNA methylase IME4